VHVTGSAAVVVLACKAFIAVLLLTAGGAKLAGLAGFAETVRLFVPRRMPRGVRLAVAACIGGGELGVGAASLSVPAAGWLNPVVLAICGCFLLTLTFGYVRHRGRPCRCFGALSRRGFTTAGIGRAAGLVAAAAAATASVPPRAITLSPPTRLGLLACGLLVGAAAYSAAAAVGAKRQPWWALWCGYRFI
jgi:hypothetical protein